MPLTNTAIKAQKPGPRPVKLFDQGGLFLVVMPSGGKWWRLKYRFDGKEKLLSLGTYSDTSLALARESATKPAGSSPAASTLVRTTRASRRPERTRTASRR